MISLSKDTTAYKSGTKYTRCVEHKYNNYINVGKDMFINDFVDEYRRLYKLCLDELWSKKIEWEGGIICLKHNYIEGEFPRYLNVTDFNCLKNYKGFLSGRMCSQVLKDICGHMKGLIKSCKALKQKVNKPNVTNINPEIPPKHVDIILNDNEDSYFTHYVKLVNLTNKRKENIVVPIYMNKMDEEYIEKGFTRLNSILLTKDKIDLRYQYIPTEKDKNEYTETVGCDMGVRKILTTSKGKSCKENKDGKTFEKLNDKIKRKEKNSVNYKKAIREMECFIQEIVNDMDLHENKCIRLEHNKGLKKSTGNSNHHWSTQIIVKKLLKVSQDNQVDYILTPPSYKFQRCNDCGFVHRKNRKGELFVCLHCHHTDDADVNAAKNSEEPLPFDNLWSVASKSKDSGFFWVKTGVYKHDRSPCVA